MEGERPKAINIFEEEILAKINYFRAEYDISYAELIGLFEIIKHQLMRELEFDDDEEIDGGMW